MAVVLGLAALAALLPLPASISQLAAKLVLTLALLGSLLACLAFLQNPYVLAWRWYLRVSLVILAASCVIVNGASRALDLGYGGATLEAFIVPASYINVGVLVATIVAALVGFGWQQLVLATSPQAVKASAAQPGADDHADSHTPVVECDDAMSLVIASPESSNPLSGTALGLDCPAVTVAPDSAVKAGDSVAALVATLPFPAWQSSPAPEAAAGAGIAVTPSTETRCLQPALRSAERDVGAVTASSPVMSESRSDANATGYRRKPSTATREADSAVAAIMQSGVPNGLRRQSLASGVPRSSFGGRASSASQHSPMPPASDGSRDGSGLEHQPSEALPFAGAGSPRSTSPGRADDAPHSEGAYLYQNFSAAAPLALHSAATARAGLAAGDGLSAAPGSPQGLGLASRPLVAWRATAEHQPSSKPDHAAARRRSWVALERGAAEVSSAAPLAGAVGALDLQVAVGRQLPQRRRSAAMMSAGLATVQASGHNGRAS